MVAEANKRRLTFSRYSLDKQTNLNAKASPSIHLLIHSGTIYVVVIIIQTDMASCGPDWPCRAASPTHPGPANNHSLRYLHLLQSRLKIFTYLTPCVITHHIYISITAI